MHEYKDKVVAIYNILYIRVRISSMALYISDSIRILNKYKYK